MFYYTKHQKIEIIHRRLCHWRHK